MAEGFDLRNAVNGISDIVQNRPPPIREVDQIYMKVADMVTQAEYTARVLDGQDVAFIGDGDSIGLSMAHLRGQGVIDYGPRSIVILDFDDRIVKSVTRFAEKYDISHVISSQLYNVAHPLPKNIVGTKDAFYTNPPWGQSNDGESVLVFVERGIETLKPNGHVSGVIVIADDQKIQWTQDVLRATQELAITRNFVIGEMLRELHLYHLDDAPGLRSCSLLIRRSTTVSPPQSTALDESRMHNFYGRNNPLTIKYIRDLGSLNYGKAPDGSYKIELLKEAG